MEKNFISLKRKWFRVAQLIAQPLRYKFVYSLVELLVDGVLEDEEDERMRGLLRQYGILEELEKARKKAEAGKKGMEARWKNNPVNNSDNNSDNNTVNNRVNNSDNNSANNSDNNTVNNRGDITNNIYNNKDIIYNNINKEKEKEKEKEKGVLEDLSQEWREVLETWFAYKHSRKELYKSDLSVKALITKLKNLAENNVATAQRIIEQSMANNWAGIYALKHNNYDQQRKNQVDHITEDWDDEENNLIRL